MPLKELIIYHPDTEYQEDILSLQQYVQDELNVVTLSFTSDEAAVGIRYKAVADWGVLGKKLRKDLGRVKKALPDVPSDAIKAYQTSGQLTVDGIDLVAGDLTVNRYVELGEQSVYDSGTDNDVVILLDIRRHADLEHMALVRELTSRVNKLRKEAGLKATDKAHIFYRYEDGCEDVLRAALSGQEEQLERAIGGVPQEFSQAPEGLTLVHETVADDKPAGERFVCSLSKA